MPLDRRVIFRGTAGPAVVFEELRKNFITLSETDAIDPCARHYLRRREPCRFSGLFLNINLAFQEGALFKRDYGRLFCEGSPDLTMTGTGFLSRSDGWDDVTWWLLERR